MIIRGTRTVRCDEKKVTTEYKLFILTDLRCNSCRDSQGSVFGRSYCGSFLGKRPFLVKTTIQFTTK